MRDGEAPQSTAMCRAMWEEITQRVSDAMRGGKVSFDSALDFVLTECRATRFYIEASTARKMLRGLVNKRSLL